MDSGNVHIFSLFFLDPQKNTPLDLKTEKLQLQDQKNKTKNPPKYTHKQKRSKERCLGEYAAIDWRSESLEVWYLAQEDFSGAWKMSWRLGVKPETP